MKHTITYLGTVLEALEKGYPDSSKTTLRSWIKEGRVFVDGVKINKTNHVVQSGQTLELKQKVYNLGPHFHILYEDRDIVVIDKPPGLLSVASETETEETAHNYLKDYFYPRRVFPVHRLDQETSGVMLFALSERARDQFKDIFETHAIERSYIAIVEGRIAPPEGTWSCYLYEDRAYYVHATDNPEKGQLAVTHYRCEKVHKNYSMLTLRLETGRKNQIRVHCQRAGHPVAGDSKYGAVTNPLSRLGLHAHLLAFSHPSTGKKMRFEVPIPKRFALFMQQSV